jgi:hypothetical protein
MSRKPFQLEYSIDLSAAEVKAVRVYEVDLKSDIEPRLLESPGEDMSTWDNTRTSQWLHSINLGQFASAFEVSLSSQVIL